jgi:ketosteroid isomerase-like protein
MITAEFAANFAAEWLDARNNHNIEKVLALYSDDCITYSPMALKYAPDTKGILEGKAALEMYWQGGFQLFPDLHLSLLDVLVGVDTITVYYLNIGTDKKAAEVLFFNESREVYKSSICYSEVTFDHFY